MKRYLQDQIGVMSIICVIAFFLFRMCRKHFWPPFILGITLLVTYAYLCRRMIALPLDLLRGKKTETLYFSRMCNIDNYELFQDQYCCEWRFYSAKGTVKVLVPASLSLDEIRNMDRPKADQKVKVCYYPHSKILYSWELV